MAAKVIVETKGDYGASRLARYEDRLTERFGSRRSGIMATDLLPSGVKRMLARRLLATEWFARRVVMDRWFLHRDQPALLP